MADVHHWSCPYCNRDATLRDHDYLNGGTSLKIQDPAEGHKHLEWYYVVCPNPKCKKFTLNIGLFEFSYNRVVNEWEVGALLRSWALIPPSRAKAFPDYIPKSILDDYNEACLISDLSPKASATLSRRCLQGILRDFWKVKPGRLVDEVEQIKDKTDPLTWDAIDSVRKVGNIGAHMEKDINLIVDVDPNEAQMLIGLIEIVLKDWYVAREERKNRLLNIKSIADVKDSMKKGKP
ncbi:MAG: DUF4145 domain-containing protein [Candidatus Omnitrophica bacterium]|nr:DUF4145 domain-containing protein [Candidatus Omnitrophota bacterium]